MSEAVVGGSVVVGCVQDRHRYAHIDTARTTSLHNCMVILR